MMKWRRRCNHCKKVVICGEVHLIKGLIIQDKECPECHGELDIIDAGHMRIETRQDKRRQDKKNRIKTKEGEL